LSTEPLREALLAEVAGRDAAIRDLSFYSTSSDGDRYCSSLKRLSRAALTQSNERAQAVVAVNSAAPPAEAGDLSTGLAAATTARSAETVARPAALQLCVSCHETGIAPLLPLSNPTLLTRELRVRRSAHGALIDEIRFRLSPEAGAQHMPLGLNLSDADRQSLEAYFAALAAAPD